MKKLNWWHWMIFTRPLLQIFLDLWVFLFSANYWILFLVPWNDLHSFSGLFCWFSCVEFFVNKWTKLYFKLRIRHRQILIFKDWPDLTGNWNRENSKGLRLTVESSLFMEDQCLLISWATLIHQFTGTSAWTCSKDIDYVKYVINRNFCPYKPVELCVCNLK